MAGLQRERTARTEARAWANDILGYAENRLGLRLWSRQREMLLAIQADPKVAIRAGRKVSKSMTLAIAALWWAEAQHGRVLITSSSGAQVKDVLWYEIRTLAARAGITVAVPRQPSTGITFPAGGEIVGRASDKRENMQGYSGTNALYIADEASGIPPEMIEALEGNLAGGGHLVLAGNPTQTSGRFFDAFHSAKDSWTRIHVSSLESPNVTGEMHIEGLATLDWAEQIASDYGETSAFYEVHVLGDFPSQAGDAVIPLALLEAARGRWTDQGDDAETDTPERLHLGVDVGWTGDDPSVIQPRRGDTALPTTQVRGQNPTQVAARVRGVARQLRRKVKSIDPATGLEIEAWEIPVIKVDVIGIGAGVYSDLLQHDWLEVHAVNVAEKPTSQPDVGPGFANLRAQLAFGVRDWLRAGSVPPDETRDGELLAIKHKPDTRGRIAITKKDELRKVLKRSTDHADALMLSIYEPPYDGPMIHVL